MSRMRLDIPTAPMLNLPGLNVLTRTGSDQGRIEAAIAVRQGRDAPFLGCLTGVQVVGGPDVVPAEKVAVAEVVESKPAPKSPATIGVAKAVEKVVEVKAPAVKKAAKPKAVTAQVVAKAAVPQSAAKVVAPKAVAANPVAKKTLDKAVPPVPVKSTVEAGEAVEDVAVTSAPSVTSMLAMQARSLSRAVAKTPVAPAKKPAVKKATDVVAPAKKVAAKSTSKKA